MPKYPTSLDVVLEKSILQQDENGLTRALRWLTGILEGVSYLHQQSLCHLDLKDSNVLINDSDVAVITDFGSLTRSYSGVDTYVSPLICRPPEAWQAPDNIKTTVDGYKYDMYTIGILATELFTNRKITKKAKYRIYSAFRHSDPTWKKVMYPVIFNILKERKFKRYVKDSFKMVDVGSDIVKSLRNFIIACVSLNPRNRPSLENALNHRLLGGCVEFQTKANDVWQKKIFTPQARFLNFVVYCSSCRIKIARGIICFFRKSSHSF